MARFDIHGLRRVTAEVRLPRPPIDWSDRLKEVTLSLINREFWEVKFDCGLSLERIFFIYGNDMRKNGRENVTFIIFSRC